jgi:hypothetical protein
MHRVERYAAAILFDWPSAWEAAILRLTMSDLKYV